MPNRHTFSIFPINLLIRSYACDGKNWADPFAGSSTFAEFRNDLNPEYGQPFCLEAHIFLDQLITSGHLLDGVLFDPPYSLATISRIYKKIGLIKGRENPTGGFPKVKDAIQRLVKPNGYSISFGWNTAGMGKKRGFEVVGILIVHHGGNHNDTLVTVERKVEEPCT